MKKSIFRRTLAATAATAVAVGATVFGVTTASAAPGDYVMFGDSFPANPGPTDAVEDLERIGRGGCPQSGQNIGHHVAGQLHKELKDYSCNGQVAYMPNTPERSLLTQIENASIQGDLKDADLITFFIGANDAMQSFWAPSMAQDQMYVDNLGIAIDRVREESPNAEIIMVGYPEIVSSDPTHIACPVNVGGVAPHIPAAPIKVYEDNLQHRQERVAAEKGVMFLNMKARVNVHVGMCDTGDGRLVSAVIDDGVGTHNMPNHATHAGSYEFASAITEASRYERLS